MLYKKYDSYGYTEPQSFKTMVEQKGLKFNTPKNVSESPFHNNSFYTENGQELTDLVTPKL